MKNRHVKQLRACRLRVRSAKSYLLASVTVPNTRKPQDWLQFPSNTFTKQKIILYLVGLNNFEVLSWGLPKFEVFQTPGFNLSWSIFHILLPDSHLSGLKEDSTVFNPGKKAPTIAHEWLPLVASGDRINHLARKSHPTPLTARWTFGWAKLRCYKQAPMLALLISALGKQRYVAFPLHRLSSPFLHAWIWFLPISSQSNKKSP